MPKSSRGFRIGIVNPLTLAGGEVKAILEERGFHYDQVDLLDSTGDETGALTGIGDEAAVVQPISELNLAPLDIVFFAGTIESNAQWIAAAEEAGCLSIDLSVADGEREGLPVVAGVNSEAIVHDSGRIVSPHPAAVPLILVLDRIRTLSPIVSGTATIIQPASRYGKKGIDEIFQQTIQALNMASLPTEVFGRQATFNLFPAPDATRAEALIRSDVTAILGALPLAVSLVQGPAFHAHSITIFVRTAEPVDEDAVRRALGATSSIEIEEEVPASTVDAGGRDAALVGRVARDPGVENGLWIWVVCDNLRRGAAVNAVAIAEQVVREFQWTN
jgi:aspartate-semialdehyde dehydrogenase